MFKRKDGVLVEISDLMVGKRHAEATLKILEGGEVVELMYCTKRVDHAVRLARLRPGDVVDFVK